MTVGWLEQAVKACALPSRPSLKDLKKVSVPLKLSLEPLPRLTSELVRDWLGAKGYSHRGLPSKSRRLHGCLVAEAGRGLLFYDSSDDESQQRFTLTHEVAHFVLDHRLLRNRALQVFGERILPVLDGVRSPSPQELLASVFHRIPFGARVRLMDRSDSGGPRTGEAMETEQRADLLAFEILAPEKDALPLIRNMSIPEAEGVLAFRFGLPLKEARAYAHVLRAREPTPRPFFLDLLIEEASDHG